MHDLNWEQIAARSPHWELTEQNESYPDSLRDLDGSAPVLRGIGDVAVLTGECISIIGARQATPYGLACARMAGRVAAECGVTVVSGGAIGCDREAGCAALDAGGVTVVVPGCGADVLYPRSSNKLFIRAVERGGCVVSIERWNTPPRRHTFVRRNRIIAALSRSLIVCEAGRPSGTFGTATTAAELGRRVYAVPGSIWSPMSRGTNWLIEAGAAIVADEQALEGLIALDYGRLRMTPNDPPETRGTLLDALVASPMAPDELASFLNLDIAATLALLAEHEATGTICRLGDGRFAPTKNLLLGQNGGHRT